MKTAKECRKILGIAEYDEERLVKGIERCIDNALKSKDRSVKIFVENYDNTLVYKVMNILESEFGYYVNFDTINRMLYIEW